MLLPSHRLFFFFFFSFNSFGRCLNFFATRKKKFFFLVRLHYYASMSGKKGKEKKTFFSPSLLSLSLPDGLGYIATSMVQVDRSTKGSGGGGGKASSFSY